MDANTQVTNGREPLWADAKRPEFRLLTEREAKELGDAWEHQETIAVWSWKHRWVIVVKGRNV